MVSQMSFIFPQESIDSKAEPKETSKKIGSRFNSTQSATKKSSSKNMITHTHPFKEDIVMLKVSDRI